MLLIGVNRSPYTRRVAVTLKAYGLPFEQRDLSGFGNRAEVRAANPLGRIPALVLDNVAALMMGACDKGLHAAYERNHHPPEKVHQPWIDDCMTQMKQALAAVEAMVEPGQDYLLLGRLTQADVTAFIAERLARGLKVDTATETPHLHAHCRKLLEQEPFRSSEP
jgi:glutathione S-transferase